jgi:hypothetical protein
LVYRSFCGKESKLQVWCVWWLMLDKNVTFFYKWYVFPPKSSKKVGFLYSFPLVTAPTLNMARSHTSPLHAFFSFREKIWVNGWFAHWCAIHMNELNVVTMRQWDTNVGHSHKNGLAVHLGTGGFCWFMSKNRSNRLHMQHWESVVLGGKDAFIYLKSNGNVWVFVFCHKSFL